MGTLVMVEAIAKAESVHESEKFLKRHVPDTRSYEGCQDITAYINEDGKTIVMVEHWDSKAHYEKYLAWREETGVLSDFGALLEGAPMIRFFDVLDT